MKTGKYMIYSFYSKENNTYEKEFFLPDENLQRKLYRLSKIASYKEKGSQIAGVLYVDKESYLNARLNATVEDYIYEDQMEEEVRKKFRRGQIDKDVYIETLGLIQDFKWTCLKKINTQIHRMVREDFDVENEIALQLYDQYLQAIL